MKPFFLALNVLVMTLSLTACQKDGAFDVLSLGSGFNGGHEYVNLGLSVKWATCNVGAENPSEPGCCFAWGETAEKESYTPDTYVSRGTLKLELKDDAANVYWKGSWHMPTEAQLQELMNPDNCEWACVRYPKTSVWGYKIKSKIPGYTKNYIFIPFTGYKSGQSLVDADECGCYWTSEADSAYPKYLAISLDSFEGRVNYPYYGFFIRAVCE